MSDELKALIFDALETAEGYVRAAAFLEVANPPHEHGKARHDLAKIHEALSQLQRCKDADGNKRTEDWNRELIDRESDHGQYNHP